LPGTTSRHRQAIWRGHQALSADVLFVLSRLTASVSQSSGRAADFLRLDRFVGSRCGVTCCLLLRPRLLPRECLPALPRPLIRFSRSLLIEQISSSIISQSSIRDTNTACVGLHAASV